MLFVMLLDAETASFLPTAYLVKSGKPFWLLRESWIFSHNMLEYSCRILFGSCLRKETIILSVPISVIYQRLHHFNVIKEVNFYRKS